MARDIAQAGLEAAASAGLRYVSDDNPGIARIGQPGHFDYRDVDGRQLRDTDTLERIGALVIPPAWTDVWISPNPRGHIQAVGRDARGRKQYRYHARWRAVRDADKYHHLAAFGRALPKLRARVGADLARPGLPREKVLAAAVRLLEITLIRVGNDEYAKTNRSFGLTTLRKRHVTLNGAGAAFEFRGKSGKTFQTHFHDRRLARVLRLCEELPGQRLFQYVDEDGERHHVDSDDVNAYLQDAMGEDFSAKDFRTWAATLSAAQALCMGVAAGERPSRGTVIACVKAVANLLGNTPAVCRASYIHPFVFDAYEGDRLSPDLAGDRDEAERALLELLDAPDREVRATERRRASGLSSARLRRAGPTAPP